MTTTIPTTAMVLAAGLGTRMRPLTNDRPKALIEVGGRSMLDRLLDTLVAGGVERAVVNVHAFADQIEDHLKGRKDLEIIISDERDALLETGGGIKKARGVLGEGPIWAANCDYVWIEQGEPAMDLIARTWDPDRMDDCVLIVPKARALGFDTPGDFFADEEGALSFRGAAAEAPYQCFVVHILDPQAVYAVEEDRFSLKRVWTQWAQKRRLHGVVPGGLWMQVGDPEALVEAEARLKAGR